MHEALHFQFIHYWQKNNQSPVNKLSQNDFEFLKESLTVVLDDSVKPLIEYVDTGYLMHQEFRKILHENWVKHHNFDKLVEYGLKRLPDFVDK